LHNTDFSPHVSRESKVYILLKDTTEKKIIKLRLELYCYPQVTK